MAIIQMPESLANMIAAGEVVERPASVVKELVENSIDANSSWIKVELKEAGIQEIKVTDNGDGISDTDCEKAFLRHATSKIKDENDLFRVHTLGFRGEALASIASVSRLTLKTSTGDKASTYLVLEGGQIKEKNISDARKGTEITVKDLFFNTPARLKYLKTLHTELGHVTDVMNRLAFSHPDIRFDVTHNGKQLFQTSGSGDLLQVIRDVYGMNVAKSMLPIKKETLDFYITGYIGKPEITRSNRNFMTIIVNGRYIKNYLLTQSIIRAYDTLLMIGRFPIAVISIEMDPYLVDFNVHPAKLEARFSKEKDLMIAIEKVIREQFQKETLIPTIRSKPTKTQSIQYKMDFPVNESKQIPLIQESKQPTIDLVKHHEVNKKEQAAKEKEKPTNDIATNELPTRLNANTMTENVEQQKHRVPSMYPIGQLHGTYILAQNETGLYMIDQHAAQERIKFEYYKKKLSQPDSMVQELLLPLTFEFSKQEAIFIKTYQEKLQEIGLFFEPFGEQTFVIRSYPSWFPEGYAEQVIREIVDQVIEQGKVDIASLRQDMAALMSCKRSIKANHYLNQDEMFQLLEDLRSTTDPFTCPHGRPIIIHFTTYEIEKMFKRIQ
ncbi:DNA mismatch repair protein MutL [Cerasibacillus quisquiliarum]|uniref:DNA mismatch repair protein MutL n=1 Tax=Cerasibacillus quisquiliarum TaxID=227865 RepID=A0A511UVA2_9BACI|nr:DNA mismatch repair endonuclease MutL [Cerasibacillus quisquiliarum]MBB5145936.1 DNA mismatch repair protein MutL [Cerasibacillus quisquiliarum]GEN30507.1 DNA mismatch repair protein MutL [Cerasibacillus quisquiliarum]